MADGWWLMARFLDAISETARSRITSLRLPMLLSPYEVYYCREAFYDIARKVPHLKNLELDVSPSAVREYFKYRNQSRIFHIGCTSGSENYFIGPVLAFAEAKIRVRAVNQHDLSSELFAEVKELVEESVKDQLAPLVLKHAARRQQRSCSNDMRIAYLPDDGQCLEIAT